MPSQPAVTVNEIRAILTSWGAAPSQVSAIIAGVRPTTLMLLRQVHSAATGVYDDAGEWLRRRNNSAVFSGRPALAMIVAEGEEGLNLVLHHLWEMSAGVRLA